jgi:hypothetical protein
MIDDMRAGRAISPGEQQPTRERATDQEIQKWISRQHGFVPESAWMLHCKELLASPQPELRPKTIRARQKKSRRFSKRSGGSGYFELIRATELLNAG